MAKLPTALDVGVAQGARPSGRTADLDFSGFDDIGQGIAALGEAAEQRNDRQAQKVLTARAAEYETAAAERATQYDGRDPGFANAETGHFDDWAKGLTEDASLSDGVRGALKRRMDDMRARAGNRAIGVEAQKRADILNEQRAAQRAQNLSVGITEFQSRYSTALETLQNDYDGSTRDFATRAGQAADTAAAEVLDLVPETDRADFQARMAGLRPSLQAQALEYEQKRSQAYIVDKVNVARANTTNTVIGNPDAFGLAFSTSEELLAGLPRALRDAALRGYRGELAAARVQGLILRGEVEQATAELDGGDYDKFLDPQDKLRLTEAAKFKSARLAADLIEALRYGDDVDAEQLKRTAAASGDPGLQAKADFALTVGAAEGDALGTLGGGGGAKGFREAAEFVIDIEGGAAINPNDNGRGASKFGFTQAFHPDIDVTKLTRPQAVARARRYWAAVGGDSLPPGLAVVAFDAAFNQGADKARRWLADSGGDVGQYLALREAEYRRLARENPAKYGDDLAGWLNRLGKVKAEAVRRQAFANVQDGLSSDPVKYALGGGGRRPLANVPALPDTPQGPAFKAALQGRLQVAALMNKQYRAPVRMLTNAEAQLYKDAIEADPVAAVDFAREAVAAVGPQAARGLLGEIGRQGQAGVTLHLADLSAAGLDGFADKAARGLALRGQGTELEKARRDTIAAELEDVKAVFAGMPELRIAAQQTAEAAMLMDQQSGDAKEAAFYVRGALGASARQGKLFGGVRELNGRPTLLPTWLASERADDALETMAHDWAATGRGPVYRDGSPVDAGRLRKSRLQLLPNGRYLLLNEKGVAYQAKGGAPFAFDWDDAREPLRAKLGASAVVGR
ncbi:MAG: hypothetical protein DI570_18920 [Phenylobacterium zucineum]|nr:MAG: hypothetical protein DI570_18920 [Phenylobacterium zucineum]